MVTNMLDEVPKIIIQRFQRLRKIIIDDGIFYSEVGIGVKSPYQIVATLDLFINTIVNVANNRSDVNHRL